MLTYADACACCACFAVLAVLAADACVGEQALWRFVFFVQLLERLNVVAFVGRLEGRTVLPYERIWIQDARGWEAALREATAFGFFGGVATVYETGLMFGLCARRLTSSLLETEC